MMRKLKTAGRNPFMIIRVHSLRIIQQVVNVNLVNYNVVLCRIRTYVNPYFNRFKNVNFR